MSPTFSLFLDNICPVAPSTFDDAVNFVLGVQYTGRSWAIYAPSRTDMAAMFAEAERCLGHRVLRLTSSNGAQCFNT